MNRSRIEWTDYTINPVKGLCPVACSYCYARAMYKRFKWNPEIRYIGREELFNQVLSIPRDKPCRIFVGSTFELFGDWVEPYWMNDILEVVNTFSFFTFIFLTKQPQNLIKFSPFPENCFVGVSATLPEQIRLAFKHLHYDVQAKVKFVSFEPMLGMILPFESKWFTASGVNWVIIGQCTPIKQSTQPKIEWVSEIVQACDKAGVKVFLKNNLSSIWDVDLPKWAIRDGGLRQEMPDILHRKEER